MALSLTYPEGAALVAGGTGHVGEGVVRCLAKADLPVVFTYNRGAERAHALEANLRSAGHTVRAVQMALTDGGSIDAAISAAQELGRGRMHTVISTGGPMIPFSRIADVDEQALEQFMAEDAMGAFRLLARGVKAMRNTGGGSLTACTTIANYRVVDFDGASPFSKGSVEALVRQIAAEEADAGIRCNAVPVSWVFDATVEQQIEQMAALPEPERGHVVTLIRQLEAQTRFHRPADMMEAGHLFAFLASDQASYITGQSVRLDGGFSL